MFPPSARADFYERDFGITFAPIPRAGGRIRPGNFIFITYTTAVCLLMCRGVRGGGVYILCSFAPDGEECTLDGGEFLSRHPANSRHSVELRTNEQIVLINNFETRKFLFETREMRKTVRSSSLVV